MTEEIAKYSLEPGDHGTTYGGNPLACTAVSKTIEIFEKKNLVEHVQELGAYLTEKLEELKSECDCVKAVKGKGLMQDKAIIRDYERGLKRRTSDHRSRKRCDPFCTTSYY